MRKNRSPKILGAIVGVVVSGAAVVSTGNNIWYALMLFCAYMAIVNGYWAIQDAEKQAGKPGYRRNQRTAQASPAPEYYDVPYAKKERAKALGLRWHRDNKKWFLPKSSPWNNRIAVQEEFKRVAA